MVSRIVAAKHIPVKLEPVGEGVTARAQPDDGPTVAAVLLQACKLDSLHQQSACEYDDDIGIVHSHKRWMVLGGCEEDEFT